MVDVDALLRIGLRQVNDKAKAQTANARVARARADRKRVESNRQISGDSHVAHHNRDDAVRLDHC